jgi:lactoylglutathione lyase
MFRSPHVRLLVSDFPACFRFYRDALGFAARFGSEGDVYTEFSVGDQTLALFRRDLMAEAIGAADRPATADAQDRAVLVFATDDVDQAAAALRTRGVALAAQPQDRPDGGVRTAHFRDPDGNLIEINSGIPA